MAQAKRDNNHVPTILGVSATDSTTPVPIEADAATKSLKVTIAGGSSSGTEYTEGDVDATMSGGAIVFKGSGNTATVPSSTNPLPVGQSYQSTDYFPGYSRADLGGGLPKTDPSGSIQIRGPILTDEGTKRVNFTGSSLGTSIGTATFTPGSYTVTGSGFASLDLHQADVVKLDADPEYAWAPVLYVVSDTELLLLAPYAGTGGTGAATRQPIATITGTGATISVASGQATIGLGTTAASETYMYTPLFRGNGLVQAAASISQRIANQDIYFGYESAPFSTIKQFARFRFTGTTNTTVICETGYSPSGAPSASEIETTSPVTIPAGDNTSMVNTYKIEFTNEAFIFSINGNIVAKHTKRIPHIQDQPADGFYISIRGLNGTTPASNTNIVVDYAFGHLYNRLDVNQTTPGDGTNSQVVQQKAALTTSDIMQSAATATGNGVSLNVDGMSTAVATVTGTFVGTITFEGSEDNGTTWNSLNVSQSGTNTIGSTATAAGSYVVNVAGYMQLRARISAYTSGSITVTAHATPHTGPARVINANLLAGSATVGNIGTVSTLTGGGVANDGVDSGNPIKVGAKASATLSTATLVAAADRVDAIADVDGAHIVRTNSTLADVVSGNASNTDGASTQVIASSGAGVKTYLTDVTITNTSASNIYVEIKDGTTTKWTFPVPANGGVTHHFTTPLAGTAATAWNFDPSAATTTVYCSAAGFKSKV